MRESNISNLLIKRGKFYGISTLAILFTFIPISMKLSPIYEQTDQLSDLGKTSESAIVFNLGVIITGMCLYKYYTLYLKNRLYYSNLRHYSLIIIFGQIAAFGTIGLGVIPFYQKYEQPHALLALMAFSGMTMSILFCSIDFYQHKFRLQLVIFGFIILLYAISYPFYFRDLPSKGYWQKIYLFFIISWHLILNSGDLRDIDIC